MGPVKKIFGTVMAMGGSKRAKNSDSIVSSSESSRDESVSVSRSTTGGKSLKRLQEVREGEEAESLRKKILAQQEAGFEAGEDDEEIDITAESGDDGTDEQFADDMFDDEGGNEEDRYVMEERENKGKRKVGESSSQAFRFVGRRGWGVATPPTDLMVTDGNCPGGPVDPSMIPSFSGHLLYAVSHDPATDRGVLNHYSQTKKMRKVLVEGWPLKGELNDLVQSSGLCHLRDCMFEEYDMPLISAFVDRWQPDTNTFHMPWGEMTILLHDVKNILGLSVDGEQVYASPTDRHPVAALPDLLELHPLVNVTKDPYKDFRDPENIFGPICDTGNVLVGALTDVHFKKKISEKKKSHAYLLALIGMSLFTGKRRDRIPAEYIGVLSNAGPGFHHASEYAWGAGTLAFLYRELGKASRAGTKGITGCLTLLQCWIYLYFPSFRPVGKLGRRQMGEPWSLVFRGKKTFQKSELHKYHEKRSELDTMSSSMVIWQPYLPSGEQVAPNSLYMGLIRCMDITEPYNPQRVIRQFGYVQNIPTFSGVPPTVANRPPKGIPYKVEHQDQSTWLARRQFSLNLQEESGPVNNEYPDTIPGYRDWYYARSHPLFLFAGMAGRHMDAPPFDLPEYLQMSGTLCNNYHRARVLTSPEEMGQMMWDNPQDYDDIMRRLDEMRLNSYRRR